MLFNLLYYILISLSICHIWSFSEFFSPFRNFISKIPYVKKPLLCPECCSFWVGFLFSFFYNPIGLSIQFPLFTNLISGVCVYFFAHHLFKSNLKNKITFINK